MAADLTKLHDPLRNLQGSSPEVIDEFLNSLRAARIG